MGTFKIEIESCLLFDLGWQPTGCLAGCLVGLGPIGLESIPCTVGLSLIPRHCDISMYLAA